MHLMSWDFGFISVDLGSGMPRILFNSRKPISGFIKIGLTGVYIVRLCGEKLLLNANGDAIVLDECESVITTGRFLNKLTLKINNKIVFEKLFFQGVCRRFLDPTLDIMDMESSIFFLWIGRLCIDKSIISNLKLSWIESS